MVKRAKNVQFEAISRDMGVSFSMGNNPMVGASVALAVAVEEAQK